jgi:hypothetical protein
VWRIPCYIRAGGWLPRQRGARRRWPRRSKAVKRGPRFCAEHQRSSALSRAQCVTPAWTGSQTPSQRAWRVGAAASSSSISLLLLATRGQGRKRIHRWVAMSEHHDRRMTSLAAWRRAPEGLRGHKGTPGGATARR